MKPDYEKMYFNLFNGVTDIIDKLKDLQKQTEEMYVNAENEDDEN